MLTFDLEVSQMHNAVPKIRVHAYIHMYLLMFIRMYVYSEEQARRELVVESGEGVGFVEEITCFNWFQLKLKSSSVLMYD